MAKSFVLAGTQAIDSKLGFVSTCSVKLARTRTSAELLGLS